MKSVTMPVLACLIPLCLFAQSFQNLNDGPYVFYEGDSIVVQWIDMINGAHHVRRLACHTSQKDQLELDIRFPGKTAYNFSVGLQPQLLTEPAVFKKPDKVFALSDIEGEFAPFRQLLVANGVMDNKYRWKFGSGHLIFCGDLFDRGSDVTAQLWLLYKLEQEARQQGGYVHVILGNHDVMNLSNDTRYVQQKYFATAALLNKDYADLFADNTELGRWLRTKNVVEKIGDLLCLHGGISPEMLQLKLPVETINQLARPLYTHSQNDRYLTNDTLLTLFGGETSPFWYRDYFFDPRAPQQHIVATLRFYNVKTIVVGHTIIPTNIGSYYVDRVIGLDVDHHNGHHQAAFSRGGVWYVTDEKGNRVPMKQYH